MYKEKDKTVADFIERCRQANLRITPQRIAIYQELIKTKEHPSAMKLFQAVRKKYPHISFDTVNRTLNTLSELGLASVLAGSGDDKRFDGDTRDHQHFRCIRCNKIIDFDCKELKNIPIPRRIREKYTVLTKTVYFEGICDNCRKNKAN